jgi:vacuolar-type H+-ATPase subunit E/Vma4
MAISDDEAEAAVNFMRDNARKAAQATANRKYLEEYRRVVKAQLMKEHDTLPLGAQEREAYNEPRFTQHLKNEQTAIEEDEYMTWMMKAADAKISAWQTLSRKTRM